MVGLPKEASVIDNRQPATLAPIRYFISCCYFSITKTH